MNVENVLSVETTTTTSPKAHESNIRVLIVDDQRLSRISLKTTLTQAEQGMTVVGEAEEGAEAVRMARRLTPDVILMDIGMPVLDGIQATRQIGKVCPKARVIMLTSHESDADVLDAFRCGATSYCLKDTAPEALLEIVRSTANGACWIDPKIARVVIHQSMTQSAEPSVGDASEYDKRRGESDEANDDIDDSYVPLTARETDVLRLIVAGKNNTEITESLCLSMNTIKTHIKNLYLKLGVDDRTAAALKAIRQRIV